MNGLWRLDARKATGTARRASGTPEGLYLHLAYAQPRRNERSSVAAKRRFMRHGPEGPILAASHPSVQEGLPVRAGRCPRRQTGSLEEKRRRCGALQSLTREETFVSEASFLGPPESYARMGRAEALVARRFSGAVSAMRLKCRMRVQNYCFFLTWQWVGPDCVRYWSGLRACAPMIGQSKKKNKE